MFFNLTTIEDFTTLLVEKRITPNQAFFCHLIHSKDFASLYRYVHEFKRFSVDEITDLEDRGYVINWGGKRAGGQFSDQYEVTSLLLDGIGADPLSMGEELWTTYPNFILVNGQKVPAKSTDKDLLMRDYLLKIKNSVGEHQKVMQALTYAKRHNRISMGIRKWIDSHQWETFFEEMNSAPTTQLGDNEF